MDYAIKKWKMASGERYCVLKDRRKGRPLYYPCLYATTQIRNKSLSVSTMTGALNGIMVLLQYMTDHKDDLEVRIRSKNFFQPYELDAIRDYCQQKFRIPSTSYLFPMKQVAKDTEYARLTSIAFYVEWLAQTILGHRIDVHCRKQIQTMVNGIKARRPPRKARSSVNQEKGLTEEQVALAFEVFRPDSELNPFVGGDIKIRNRLIFLMLYHLGLRGGELLCVRIRDIDFGSNQLVVVRRPDEKDDPRTDQPLAKTLDRRVPLGESLGRHIHDYIVKVRKLIPYANKNDFLFITHKSGPTQGQPLSKSAYKRIIELVRSAAPDLYRLTGHDLRHTWNDNFSRRIDAMNNPPSEEEQEKMRSYLMGWKEGSGTAKFYNKRFVIQKAHEASLDLQASMQSYPQKKESGVELDKNVR